MQIVISAVVVLMLFVGGPLWLLFSLRSKSFGELVYGKSGQRRPSSFVGNAMQELDRLMARPSIEYRIEAENRSHLLEDERGGERNCVRLKSCATHSLSHLRSTV